MATEYERLAVMLEARVADFEKKIASATRNAERNFKRVETTSARMQARLNSTYSGIAASAAKAFALIGGAQGFRQLSDSGTRITNSLKVAGLAGEELEGVYQKLFAAAQKNAAPLETLVQLYGRVSLVQKELGVSSDEIISLSSNVALALRASGQSSQEASGALLQLSQALGGGVVRAEEFNSILEGAPTILQAAAAGIKQAEGSVAKLRNIMLEGKLSSKALFDGLNAGAPVLEQKVAGAVLTVDHRLENLRTALTNAVRKFNDSTRAANTFGGAIDNMANFVNSVDMDGLASDIQYVIDKLNTGADAAQNFARRFGEALGLNKLGQGLIGALDGDGDGKLTAFGGALGVESTIKGSQKLVDNTQKRLDLEKQIAEIKANPANVLGQAEIRVLEGQIKALEGVQTKTASSIIQDVLNDKPLKYPTSAPTIIGGSGDTKAVNGKKFTPIDITDKQYQVTPDKDGKSSKKRADEYAREVEQITKRTAALQAETAAQAGLNPLLNDYGHSIEFARAKQELLTAAQEAGIKITPELTASIEDLAAGYANAVVESERLSEKQDEIRQRAEEAMETAKDVTRGMIDGFIEGASAADILADSLKKIGNALLDDVLNNIFKINNAGGGGGGFLSGLVSLFGGGGKSSFPSAPGGLYSEGGYTGDGGKYQPAGVVHKGEYVMDADTVRRAGGPAAMEAMRRGLKGYADGGYVGAMPSLSPPSIPDMKSVTGGSGGSAVTLAPVYHIDARGADAAAVARLEKGLAKTNAEMQSRIEAGVRSAQKRNVKL
ncbi:tape measure protein [Agrobacterium tumefaciens]|uniref:tape measure protein n=3 Tax=Agrobacterium tumefaciens TaxID=358 RepID=UPI0015726C9E|nr:tape measure protein [Agrobacterium tumefaciens]NTD96115.1 tape measure protein [Agrobacterium tumefaciens]NTE13974.1 tape measure protein [Agrobacterium tumefaciens]NTE19588.1 tape measure protein [Agrobacterium tumefaciens]NTE28130.1 tape measure protein [Agrobacterium tumefaciens]NTE95568.1 tape measure protein [Agrobacterium tumefaciens]